jgi:hypothetical protein
MATAKVDAEGTPRLCVWHDEDEWSGPGLGRILALHPRSYTLYQTH